MRFGPAVALILALWPATGLAEQRAKLLGAYLWDVPGAGWFGGVSGLDLGPDGSAFVAVTDRGTVFQGTIQRDGSRIQGVALHAAQKLNGSDRLAGSVLDAEGVALRPDGSFCVSFEGTSRTGCYPGAGHLPHVLQAHPDFDGLHGNATLEALAVDARNRLITIPEDRPAGAAGYPLYRWQSGRWRRVMLIPASGRFRPVGADFGPDGRLYLLERAFLTIGFRSRVRSFAVSADVAHDERLHLNAPLLLHGNLEGLSVWQDAEGRIRLTMVSDDNFHGLQRSEIVEYALPPLASGGVTD